MSETMTQKQLEGSEIQTGACRFCGQIYQFETDGRATENQLNAWAAEKCDCIDARIEQKHTLKADEAKENMMELIEGRECDPEKTCYAKNLICDAIDLLAHDRINSAVVVTREGYKLSATINSKGNLKTEISRTVKKSKEA